MTRFYSTKEIAAHLKVNEKMVYTLINEKGMPATKITGKWMFPVHLVDRWVDNNTINYPSETSAAEESGLLILAGSNDILLERLTSMFMRQYPEYTAAFSNLGSLGGLKALKRGVCHLCASHLLQDDQDAEFNFAYAERELERAPAIVNFCRREQGLIVQKGNPLRLNTVEDLAKPGVRIANRAEGTGTRVLLDRLMAESGVLPEQIEGYDRIIGKHMDVGIEVLAGRIQAGPGIRAVASLLGLDFVPFGWERFDLITGKERFFDKGVQLFLGMLNTEEFKEAAETLEGYDVSRSGQMVFPKEGGE